MSTVIHESFEWDEAKAAANARKHEVVHVLRGERTRLISARRATVNEEKSYADRRGH